MPSIKNGLPIATRVKMASILDSSAVIALWNRETGWERIEGLLNFGSTVYLSTVSLAEIVTVYERRIPLPRDARVYLEQNRIELIEFTDEDAIETGRLVAHTGEAGLSLGDRACIAASLRLGAVIYTADQAWSRIDFSDYRLTDGSRPPPIEIVQIRGD